MTYTRDQVFEEVQATRTQVIAKGGQELQDQLPTIPKYRDAILNVFLVGDWLSDRFAEHGVSGEQSEQMCMAAGQRMFGNDPFEIGAQVMNRFLEGQVDKPGRELGEELADEFITTHIDKV